ncbi:hypothetical protein IZY60_11525 [Lutibacter sp. B2]|nr:hypothetical protein [Lutibacter sp. B2]
MLEIEFQQEDIVMINMSKRFNNSLFIIKKYFKQVCLIKPEYLVIQVGIVDCWARKKEINIFE